MLQRAGGFRVTGPFLFVGVGGPMKDLNGVTIDIGDRVAYATRDSSVAHLRTGVVVELTERDKIRVQLDGSDRVVTVGHAYRYLSGERSATVFVYKKAPAPRKKRARK